LKKKNNLGIVKIRLYLFKASTLTKIKQNTPLLLGHFIMLWFISACAYEPKTIVKTPRNFENNTKSAIKKPTPIKQVLAKNLAKELTKTRKQKILLPMVKIDLSHFTKNLIGLNKFEILEILDQPNFKRTEHPASIWQYESAICFLDIFFYFQKTELIVDHVETRSKNIKKISEKRCASSLLDAEFNKSDNQKIF